VSNEVIQAYNDNEGYRILKIHLFDDSINIHGWGIDRELAASLAAEYAQNTPYLIPPTLNHPVRPYAPLPDPITDINDIKRFAAQYKAGECFKTELCASAHSSFGFDGYIKLTDPRAIEAFDKGYIPRYSSIALYDLSNERKAGLVTKAQALNICAVGKPAYPNAFLLGACKGNEVVCHSNLKNAGTTDTKNDYCILKTLENSDYDRFTINTSLNSENLKQASYNQMSQQATSNNDNVVTLAPSTSSNPQQSNTSTVGVGTPGTSTGTTSVPIVAEIPATKKEEQPSKQKEVEQILDHKKAYEDLLLQTNQKDALLLDMQKRINKFEKDQEALKIKEIERYVTIDLFNGDTKAHTGKVKEWKDRAEVMGLEDLSWHLTESYGRKLYDKEKKAGLQYEPTAVLTNGNAPQKKFSIYEIGNLDLTKGGDL
jgi:hypothetical protein